MFASIAKRVKPCSRTRCSRARCFMRKNSLVPWVCSPSATTRASPTRSPSAARSSRGAPASTPTRGLACSRSQAMTAAAPAASPGSAWARPAPVKERRRARTTLRNETPDPAAWTPCPAAEPPSLARTGGPAGSPRAPPAAGPTRGPAPAGAGPRDALRGRLQRAVVGDDDVAVDDPLLDVVDLVDELLRDQGLVVLVEREVDAVLGQAEVQQAALERAVHDVHDRVVGGHVDALEHAREAEVQRGRVAVGVPERVLVAVDADEEDRGGAGAA